MPRTRPTAPQALIYKRTHPGDPDRHGRFGNEDCMGRVRNCRYDVVIGVGGISWEPRLHRLIHKINWVGRRPQRGPHPDPRARGALVQFARGDFLVLEERGPLLQQLSPVLARRVFGSRNRFLNECLTPSERLEAARVVDELLANPVRYGAGVAGGGASGGCPPCSEPPPNGRCWPRRCQTDKPHVSKPTRKCRP